MPITKGHFPQNAALQAFFGNGGQTAQANLPVRTNLEWPIYSGALVDTASLGGTTTGVYVAVPVPVDVGMEVSKISVFIGAGAAGTPTHSYAALYSGTTVATPPLIGQTVDGQTAAIAASTRFDFGFAAGSQLVITAAQAPYGFVYAAIVVTASTMPSCVTTPAGAAACQYRWFTNTPLYFSQTATAAASTAPATLVETGVLTVAPVVALW